jgi:hypothetical protein
MSKADIKEDEKQSAVIEKGMKDNLNSSLLEFYKGIQATHPQFGSISVVIDLIQNDVISDYNMKKYFTKKKLDTLDSRTAKLIFSAA